MADFLQRYIQENKKLLKTEQYVTSDDMTADEEVDVELDGEDEAVQYLLQKINSIAADLPLPSETEKLGAAKRALATVGPRVKEKVGNFMSSELDDMILNALSETIWL